MRKTGVTAMLLVLLLAAPARAQTESREKELTARFESISGGLSDREREPLRGALADYLAARRDAVARLLALLDDSSEGNEQSSKWAEIVKQGREAANSKFDQAISSIREPSIAAEQFVWTATIEEVKYWDAVGQADAAAIRDFLVRSRVTIVKLVDDLARKWDQMRRDDEYFDSGEAEMTAAIRQLVEDAVREQVEARRTYLEKMAALSVKAEQYRKEMKLPLKFLEMLPDDRVKYLAKLAQLALEVNEPIGKSLKAWLTTNERYQRRTADYTRYTDREGVILVVFQQTRESVKEFLRANDFPQVKERWKGAREKFDRLAGDLVTDGQKTDFAALGREASDRLGRRLGECEEKYRDFVAKNEGLFFGPAGPDVREALLEKSQAEAEKRWLLDQDIDGRLRAWLDETKVILTVSTDLWESAEERNAIRNIIRDNVDQLIDALEGASELLKDDRIEKLYDRSGLEERLR